MEPQNPDAVSEASEVLKKVELTKDEDSVSLQTIQLDESTAGDNEDIRNDTVSNRDDNENSRDDGVINRRDTFVCGEECSVQDINSDTCGSGPVSLSQILEREACAPLSPHDSEELLQKVSSLPNYECSGSNVGQQQSPSSNNKLSDTQISDRDSERHGEIVELYTVDLAPQNENLENKGDCSYNDPCSVPLEESGHTMYSTHYKLPPLGSSSTSGSGKSTPISTSSGSAHKNLTYSGGDRSMGNGSSAAHNKADKYPTSSSSSLSSNNKMPFGMSSSSSKGISSSKVKEVVYPNDYLHLKEKVKELKERKKEDDLKLDMHQAENNALKRDLRAKNDEITQLKRENHKLKVNVYSLTGHMVFS